MLKALKSFDQGITRTVADGAHLPTVQVLNHHAFEQIIDVLRLELQFDRGFPFDLTTSLKIAYPAGIEDQFSQGKNWFWDFLFRTEARVGSEPEEKT